LRKLSLLTTLPSFGGSPHSVAALAFDPSAHFLAAGGSAGMAAFSAKTWEQLAGVSAAEVAEAEGEAVRQVCWAADARALLGLTGKSIVQCAPGTA
jgi:hypothetical protein